MDDIARMALDVLLEDFKARWQELLNIQSEINTWAITYLTAMFLSIAWILGQKNQQIVTNLFKNQRILILSIAVVNAGYMVMLSAKDYRLQQDALYIYQEIAPRVSDISGERFNTWEEWRRQNTLTWGRFIYNLLIILPILAISGFIIFRYAREEQLFTRGQRVTRRAIYWHGVLLFNLSAAIVAGSYQYRVNQSWRSAIQEQTLRNQRQVESQVSPRAKVMSRGAIWAMQKALAATNAGIDLPTYASLVTEANLRTNEASILLLDNDFKREIQSSLQALLDARQAWELSLSGADYLPLENPQVDQWIRKYSIDTKAVAEPHQIHRDVALRAIWAIAQAHINNANLRLTDLR
jgi:hypothetical protein